MFNVLCFYYINKYLDPSFVGMTKKRVNKYRDPSFVGMTGERVTNSSNFNAQLKQNHSPVIPTKEGSISTPIFYLAIFL
jgi:hypothetical protein